MKQMKGMKIRCVLIAVAVMLALPTMAQWETSTMQRTDRYASGYQATAPTTTFHSTGSMVGVGSAYSSTPTLNADGTAAYGYADYSPSSSPRGHVRKTGTPGLPNPENKQPLGDLLFPLLLLAFAYAMIKFRNAIRRKI